MVRSSTSRPDNTEEVNECLDQYRSTDPTVMSSATRTTAIASTVKAPNHAEAPPVHASHRFSTIRHAERAGETWAAGSRVLGAGVASWLPAVCTVVRSL